MGLHHTIILPHVSKLAFGCPGTCHTPDPPSCAPTRLATLAEGGGSYGEEAYSPENGRCLPEYERASKMDQFMTRFLLRETVSQLQALQSSLEGASDTLEAQARGPRSDEHSVEVQSRSHGSRRAGRRALRSVGRSPTWSPGSSSSDTGQSSEAEMQWRLQVNRLQELIDQLECKAPRLEPLHEEEPTQGPESHILVAQRQVQVAEEALQDFHRALCCYVDFTGAQSHCLHVSAQKMLDNASFTLYEFWQDEASWRRHQNSACSKAFQRILIDHLRAPDTLTTVFFPASWWIMNNN
ncbi:N-terminal EF-hand calcium-binding protein 3 isoform X3 [Lutra lutra]|uniref:N-terminal EF-hand calcium-binding protein 3 isoform X3 n=1 Tax=Lutra lutra TaxID=9657 RepID=UPI001FD2FDF5|nr:N-terminal EF-hand calcium-binding protein 3 isoform X3 [Lutra lutra]